MKLVETKPPNSVSSIVTKWKMASVTTLQNFEIMPDSFNLDKIRVQ